MDCFVAGLAWLQTCGIFIAWCTQPLKSEAKCFAGAGPGGAQICATQRIQWDTFYVYNLTKNSKKS